MDLSSSSYVAVFDIETQQKIQDMPGRYREDKIKLLEISCASIVFLSSELCLDPADRQRAMELSTTKTFWCDGEGAASLTAMCALLEGAECIVGFNLAGFDWFVMQKYFQNDEAFRRCREKTLDVFSRVRDATGIWFKLDALLQLNALEPKTTDGLQAIRWWLQGERVALREYSEMDVKLCASLALLPILMLDSRGRTLSNYNYGIASALAALRMTR